MFKERYIIFWSLLIIVSLIFYIKDNWANIRYKHTDKKLIKKAKKHRARHRKNILKKRKREGKK